MAAPSNSNTSNICSDNANRVVMGIVVDLVSSGNDSAAITCALRRKSI